MKVLLTRPVKLPSSDGVGLCVDNGLGYVAAACARAGAEVKLLGWNVDLDAQAFRRVLGLFQPGIVGVKVFTPWFREARATLELVRQELPDAITIIGGPHPSTSRPDDLFLEFNGLLDLAIAGDGEAGMTALLPKLAGNKGIPPAGELADVPGLIYRTEECVRANPRCLDTSLDELPELDWRAQELESFKTKLLAGEEGNTALVSDSRGCPGRCGHCMAWLINGGQVRQLSPSRLCATLGELIRGHGVRVFEFTGNCFLADKGYVREVCQWIIDTGIPVSWGCTGAEFVDSLRDRELLRTMARAGCSTVHFGVESGNREIVKQLRKPFTLEQMGEAVKRTTEAGIDAIGYFMFGFPEETPEQMKDTIEYAMSLPFSQRAFCICLPLPGTSSHAAILRQRGIDRIDWGRYDFANPKLLPCRSSPRAVRSVLRKARELQMSPLGRWRSRLGGLRSIAGRMKNRVFKQ